MLLEIVELNNKIWDYLRSITFSLEYAFRPICERFDLTMMQVRILLEIKKSGLHTVGSLSKQMSMAGGNTSLICKRMEKEGFITRLRNRQDERVVHLKLSDKGEEIISRMYEELHNRYTEQLSGLDENEVNNLMNSLSRLDSILSLMNDGVAGKDALTV